MALYEASERLEAGRRLAHMADTRNAFAGGDDAKTAGEKLRRFAEG